MAAASRKRCCSFIFLTLAVFLTLQWIHDEVFTVKLVETARKYAKDAMDGSAVAYQAAKRSSRHHNETSTRESWDNDSAFNAANETPTMGTSNIVPESESIQAAKSVHNTTINATIVVYLSGEMGNHLSILAKALSVKLMALEHGISAEFVFRHQSRPKWVSGRDSIQKCFPKLRHCNFSAANTEAFDQLAREQDRLLVQGKWDPARLKLIRDNDDKNTIESALLYWKSILGSSSHAEMTVDDSVPVWFPFLSVALWCHLDLLDRYLDQIRTFFEFDKSACCRLQADPDESVFHLRNFLVELPRIGKAKGFEELSPNKTAFELFAHLHNSDKVAITTRFGGEKVEPYLSALKERGLQVRVIQNQTGTEDFCFLLSAQKELVGTLMSTFVDWAAYLGDMKRANLYRVLSPNTRAISYPSFNWTHPNLKDRVYTKAYKSEEQELLDANEQQRRMLLYQEEWTENFGGVFYYRCMCFR